MGKSAVVNLNEKDASFGGHVSCLDGDMNMLL